MDLIRETSGAEKKSSREFLKISKQPLETVGSRKTIPVSGTYTLGTEGQNMGQKTEGEFLCRPK